MEVCVLRIAWLGSVPKFHGYRTPRDRRGGSTNPFHHSTWSCSPKNHAMQPPHPIRKRSNANTIDCTRQSGFSLPQMLLTCSLIQWTTDCEKALDRGDKKGLKSLKKKQVHTGYLCAGSSNWRSSDQLHKSVLMLETDWIEPNVILPNCYLHQYHHTLIYQILILVTKA